MARLTTLSVTGVIQHLVVGWLVDKEREKVWREHFVTQLDALSQNLPGGTE